MRCGGYEKSIFFTAEDADHDVAGRFRRPLFTERERENMSRWLTSHVPPKKAFRLLSQIDYECESASLSQDISINHGPFGVFRLVTDRDSPVEASSLEDSADNSSTELVLGNSNDYAYRTELVLSPWAQDLFSSAFDQPDPVSLPFFTDPTDMQLNVNSCQHVFGSNTLFASQDLLDASLLPHSFGLTPPFMRPPSSRPLTPTMSPLSTSKDCLPPDALPLLQHYSSTVIGALTPYRHTKTPWHVLFLPYVRQCLAILVLNDRLDHAGMCIFYGALSLSAFSLGGSTQTSNLLDSARTYKDLAQRHAQIMLRHAYDIPKKFKYKSVLMALLTLIHGTLFLDDRSRTEFYLLEAEKLIRLRGLSRRKSRKVRLLHHCYAFTRVFHESISFVSINTPQRDHVRSAVEASGVIVSGADLPSFRIRGWSNWNEEMMLLKPQDEGENDLHLERPGHFPFTLYPEIFGLPEPWLLLLSQVIRLGNEKEAAESGDAAAPLELRDFTNRAKAIERAIMQLNLIDETDSYASNFYSSASTSTGGNSGAALDPYIQRNMLEAMQEALAIYFYRRIYDIHALMLQTKVRNVRDSVVRIQKADADVPYGSAGFMWPAFIAACEAEDMDVQLSFSQWFAYYAQRSGLPSFLSTLALIERVRKAKRQQPDANVSWHEIMKNDFVLHQHG